jgi:ubiquinone/menaquinone biosynthesis C-methylase UbiE
MQTADTVFAGSIPVLYDRYLGPALFEPYAADLAERLRFLSEGHVLESAAGTGRVTRALCRTLPPEVAIIATDLNQAMLDFAAAQPGAERVVWRQADATALPFEDSSFDAVVCQFGIMFFPDKAAGYREAFRVLRPGGRFVFSVWDRIEDNEFAKVTTEALATLFPADPPLFLARTPYGHYRIEPFADALRAAGFRQVAVEPVEHTSRLDSARDLAVGFCRGSPLRNEIEARRPGSLQEITEAAASGIAARLGHGPIAGKMRAYVITATR